MNIMSTDFRWLFDYLAECKRRGEEPVSVSNEYVDQSWENQQLIDTLQERTTPSFASRADFYRDMLTRRIEEHIAIWEAKAAQPQPPAQP